MISDDTPHRSFTNLLPVDIRPTALVLATVFVFGSGVGFHWVIANRPLSQADVVAQLWKRLAEMKEWQKDPEKRDRGSPTSSPYVPPVYDIEPLLQQLAAEGELDHIDLVLPTVPARPKFARHWMEFVHAHSEIIEATANRTYTAYSPKGEQPMRFHLWIRKGNEALVQRLIRELEDLASAKSSPAE